MPMSNTIHFKTVHNTITMNAMEDGTPSADGGITKYHHSCNGDVVP